MLINKVCKECNLTKKAIEYYEKQRLVQPQVLENGYRDFSNSEIEQLKTNKSLFKNLHKIKIGNILAYSWTLLNRNKRLQNDC